MEYMSYIKIEYMSYAKIEYMSYVKIEQVPLYKNGLTFLRNMDILNL